MKALRNFLGTPLLLAAASVAFSARAALTHGIQGLSNTNYTGYVIDADAATLNPVYHREHLLVQSRVRTTNPDLATVATYYLRYRLLDSAGQPHPLYDSTGLPSPEATYNLTNTFGIAGATSLARTNVAALRPAARLNPAETYAVELRVFTPGGFREVDAFTTSPQTYTHFTNLVSNDPGLNVSATVDDVG